MPGRRAVVSGLLAAALLVVAIPGCGRSPSSGELRIYTSVTQDTVDAVVKGFETAHPGIEVVVFRAPTGELAARIAAERREGGLQADVLWLSDPLTIYQYERDGLLRTWVPDGVDAVPAEYRTDSFFGTRLLNLVIVAGSRLDDPPRDWRDLEDVAGGIALPDPGFAGTAFGALAFFGLDPGYGFEFYAGLAAADARQVRSPGDVINGVAEGVFAAGITLDRLAQAAVEDGSPVVVVWPQSGAVPIYSPIAVVDATPIDGAESFVEFVIGVEAQTAIAATGWQPIRADVPWRQAGPHAAVDWASAFDGQEELLSSYRAVFES